MVAALFLVLVGYSLFMPATEGRVGILHQELFHLFRPLHVATTSVGDWITSVWNHYIYLIHTAEENDQLRKEVGELRNKIILGQEAALENDRLHDLLAMGAHWSKLPIVARVIAITPQPDVRTLVIDKGWADGVVRDRPVMSGSGLVGRIRMLSEHTATVLLITDSSSAVDVIDSRSRVRGLLAGSMNETVLKRPVALTQLEYVTHDSDLLEGDELLTSGMDGVYPKGLPVGKVQEVNRGEFGLFEDAWVVPLADMERLEEVLIL